MKKRNRQILCLILVICLLFTLTGCGLLRSAVKAGAGKLKERFLGGRETVENTVEEAETDEEQDADTEEPDVTEPAEDIAPDTDQAAEQTDDTEDPEDVMWKKLYIRLLDVVREDIPDDPDAAASSYTPTEYYLYDIDKDGIPEMIIKRGSCEADYNGDLIKNDGYAARAIQYDLALGHSALYTDPNENGIIFEWAHMGAQDVQRATLQNNELQYEELFSDYIQDPDQDYTEVNTIVPGAVYLNAGDINQDIYVLQYENILAGMEGNLPAGKHVDTPDPELSAAVDQVITYGGAVVCVRSDRYSPDLGTIPFDEMLTKLDQWGNIPFDIERQQYADIDCDGTQECVLWLKQQGEDSERIDLCVLSLQDGKMYAYIVNYAEDCTLADNGVFTTPGTYSYSFRLAFDHDQCMRYFVYY